MTMVIPLHFPGLTYRQEGLEVFGTSDTRALIAASAGGSLVLDNDATTPEYVVCPYKGDQRENLNPNPAEVAISYIQALCRQGVRKINLVFKKSF